jgi:Domain of unknown function (DUF4399)
MNKSIWMVALLVTSAAVAQAEAPARTEAAAGAEAYIIAPADKARVKNPVTVRFGLKGMGIAPAGIQVANTGHHHLFVDTALPADMSQPIPVVDGKIIHFGKGQTETTLTLTPGKHTLQLLVGDLLHIPNAQPVASQQITVTVSK